MAAAVVVPAATVLTADLLVPWPTCRPSVLLSSARLSPSAARRVPPAWPPRARSRLDATWQHSSRLSPHSVESRAKEETAEPRFLLLTAFVWRSGSGFDYRIERDLPRLRLVHRDDRTAEIFLTQNLAATQNPKFPIRCTRILQQQTGRAVWEHPHACERNFTHG